MNSNSQSGQHPPSTASNPFLNNQIGETLATQSINGFKFAEKRAKLDWRSLEEANVDQMIKDADVARLERHLQNVTYANIDKADLKRINDKNILKMFKLGQLATEYLLYTQGVAESIADQRQREYESAYRETMELQDQIKAN
jgi:hypothetical protein